MLALSPHYIQEFYPQEARIANHVKENHQK